MAEHDEIKFEQELREKFGKLDSEIKIPEIPDIQNIFDKAEEEKTNVIPFKKYSRYVAAAAAVVLICVGIPVVKAFSEVSLDAEPESANLLSDIFDGSYGIKGFVTEAMKEIDYTHFFTCGPEPMLKAVWNASETSGQLSFEERMGCGFGACMGCSCKTLTGFKRICKDGPIMMKEEILWKD